ncbi:hypothetical protein Tcan_00965, partial [Toxocara canis]
MLSSLPRHPHEDRKGQLSSRFPGLLICMLPSDQIPINSLFLSITYSLLRSLLEYPPRKEIFKYLTQLLTQAMLNRIKMISTQKHHRHILFQYDDPKRSSSLLVNIS